VNKIEALKSEKDGLEVTEDLVRFARDGWKTIAPDDTERLKWVGVFHRKPTPGHFMMRVRMPNGIVTAAQARLLGEITVEAGRASGRPIADITTRQQLQLRWVTIEKVHEVIARLEAAGLSSLQTGMDNIRGIVGCPATGLTPGSCSTHRGSPRRSRRSSSVTKTSPTCRGSSTSPSPAASSTARAARLRTSRSRRPCPATLPGSTSPLAASRARAAPCWPRLSTPSWGLRRPHPCARPSRWPSAITGRARPAAAPGWHS
jgi:sulfite reductase beta subunit-like hemoprotein